MDEITKTAAPEQADGAAKPAYLAVLPSPVRYDTRLPASAKLLYAEISALSESYGYAWASNDYFARLYGISERTVIRLINALEAAGYLITENGGTSKRRLWCNLNHPAFPGYAAPRTDKNVTAGDKNVSGTDKNVTAIYNVREKRKKETDPPIAPQGGRGAERKSAPNWKPERFEAFWRYYPAIPDGNGRGRRPAKDRAARAWDKLRPDDDTIKAMGVALMRQKESRQWKDGVGIPYASTWLNGRVWEEESEALPSPAGAMPDDYGEGRKDLVQL